MSSITPISTSTTGAATRAHAVRIPGATLAITVLLALAVLYFLGVDQGAYSVFGSDTHVHEMVHDARHFLGFPCH